MVEEHYFLVYEAAGRILGDVVPRLAKRLEIQRPVPFYPFPFQIFKPRYYSLAIYVRERSQRNAIFCVYIWRVVRFLSFQQKWKKFANRGERKNFFSLFFLFLSLKSLRSMFLWDNFLYANCRKGWKCIYTSWWYSWRISK